MKQSNSYKTSFYLFCPSNLQHHLRLTKIEDMACINCKQAVSLQFSISVFFFDCGSFNLKIIKIIKQLNDINEKHKD